MNLNERFDVSEDKLRALRERMRRLRVDPAEIQESFVRGGGKGGQKTNKTSNCVQLRYPLMDLVVRCRKDRRRTVNRFLALRELMDRIEERVSPGTSARLRQIAKLQKRKAKRRGRAKKKYGGGGRGSEPGPTS